MDLNDDFIVVTVGLYKFFMAHGKDGLDAKQLYDHLVFTSRVQGSKAVRANMQYIQNGLGWGFGKVKKAKAFLSAAGLIEYRQKGGDDGRFQEQRIIIKTRWDEESLAQWIERKQARAIENDVHEESLVVDNSDGLEIVPPAHIVSSDSETPDNRWDGLPTTGFTVPPVSEDNYKGVITRNPSAKPPEEKKPVVVENSNPNPPSTTSPPPTGSKDKSLEETKSVLIAMVKERDPESRFCFIRNEMEQIKIAFKLYGSEWLIEHFHEYLKSKSVFQVNRFHGEDLPRFIQRELERQKSKPIAPKDPEPKKLCPCCGTRVNQRSTMGSCGKCGLDLKDFDDPEEVASHIDWWEEFQGQKRACV